MNSTWSIHSDGAVVQAYTRRPQIFNAFQLKRRMARVFFEQLVIFIRKFPNFAREFPVQLPEVR